MNKVAFQSKTQPPDKAGSPKKKNLTQGCIQDGTYSYNREIKRDTNYLLTRLDKR